MEHANIHRCSFLDEFIGKSVTITFKDGKRVYGLLVINEDGRCIPYRLKTPSGDWVFYKSHIKEISEGNFASQ